MIFVELPVFTRVATDLFDDEALQGIQEYCWQTRRLVMSFPAVADCASCVCRSRAAASAAGPG